MQFNIAQDGSPSLAAQAQPQRIVPRTAPLQMLQRCMPSM